MKSTLKIELESLKKELFGSAMFRHETPENKPKWNRFDEILKILYA